MVALSVDAETIFSAHAQGLQLGETGTGYVLKGEKKSEIFMFLRSLWLTVEQIQRRRIPAENLPYPYFIHDTFPDV